MAENWDEAHFVIKMDNGKTLGFSGDNDVKHADVGPGGMGLTMVIRLTSGPYAEICTPLMIFQIRNAVIPSM
jgi:hypothetical protein